MVKVPPKYELEHLVLVLFLRYIGIKQHLFGVNCCLIRIVLIHQRHLSLRLNLVIIVFVVSARAEAMQLLNSRRAGLCNSQVTRFQLLSPMVFGCAGRTAGAEHFVRAIEPSPSCWILKSITDDK